MRGSYLLVLFHDSYDYILLIYKIPFTVKDNTCAGKIVNTIVEIGADTSDRSKIGFRQWLSLWTEQATAACIGGIGLAWCQLTYVIPHLICLLSSVINIINISRDELMRIPVIAVHQFR